MRFPEIPGFRTIQRARGRSVTIRARLFPHDARRGVIRPATLVLGFALFLAVPGCAEELGPERFVTTRVTGIVREGREPVSAGFIEFSPIDGTVGKLTSAPIGRDGRFVAEGV